MIALRNLMFPAAALWVLGCGSRATSTAGTETGRVDLAAPATVQAATERHHAADAYYLSTCATCGGLLGAKGVALERVYAGREVRFCSESCRVVFEAAPDAAFARLDRVMIADQIPHYPIRTSIVSGRELGSDPVDFIWGNRLFRVSDAAERERVLTDPTGFIRALDAEVVRVQAPDYGMPGKCPVQGDILASDTPIDIVVANRMIRVCCARCVRVVVARPSQYLSMVEYANRAARERREVDATERP